MDIVSAVPTIDELLDELRATYARVEPGEAARAAADGGLLIDIRPRQQRADEGEIPDALIIERNVLEWRLAPTSAHRIPDLVSADQAVVVLCSEGYASTLAAVSLRSLGLTNATDLVGGFRAWRAAGLPTRPFEDPATRP